MSLDRKIEPPRVSQKLGQFWGGRRAGRFGKQVWFGLSNGKDDNYDYDFILVFSSYYY